MRERVKAYFEQEVKWLRYRAAHGEDAAEVKIDELGLDALWKAFDDEDCTEANEIGLKLMGLADVAMAEQIEEMIK